MLAGWAGWVIDYAKPVYLVAEPSQLAEATRILLGIGLDDILGYFDAEEIRNAKLATQQYECGLPTELAPRILSGEVTLLDVRADDEWRSGHIPAAEHRFLGRLPDALPGVAANKPIVTQCLAGGRSAIAASILQAAGRDVINMTGGIEKWKNDGLPIETPARVDG